MTWSHRVVRVRPRSTWTRRREHLSTFGVTQHVRATSLVAQGNATRGDFRIENYHNRYP